MDVLKMYEEKQALLRGYFLLSSGLCSDVYLQSALVLQYPEIAEKFGQALANKVRSLNIQVVISPAMGGLFIGHEVARALGARSLFVERNKEGQFELRRNFQIYPGERVLIVEDVVTTGKSTQEVIDVLLKLEGQLVGTCSIIDRAEKEPNFKVPYFSLAKVKARTFSREELPAGVVPVKPGSREEKKS